MRCYKLLKSVVSHRNTLLGDRTRVPLRRTILHTRYVDPNRLVGSMGRFPKNNPTPSQTILPEKDWPRRWDNHYNPGPNPMTHRSHTSNRNPSPLETIVVQPVEPAVEQPSAAPALSLIHI